MVKYLAKIDTNTTVDGYLGSNNFTVSGHYTGFPDRTSTSISWADAGYTLTLTATDDPIWINGVSYTINTLTKQLSVAQEAASGLYFFWLTESGGVVSLNASVTFPGFYKCLVATVYWNTTTNLGIISDERHWMGRDQWMHEYLHETVGARYSSGLAGVFTNTTFSIDAGEFYDEDIEHDITPAKTTCRVLYHEGSNEWKWIDASTSIYKDSAGVLQYNNGTALASVGVAKFVNYWVFASGDVSYPIHSIIGTTDYNTIALARSASMPSFGGLPSAEEKIIYKVTYQNVGGTATYVETTDYRSATNLPNTSYVPTDHGSLAGLADDDHVQYSLVDGARAFTGGVSINATTPLYTYGGLDISSGGRSLVIGADNDATTRTNATIKYSRIAFPHYTNAEELIAGIFTSSSSTSNTINYGGSSASHNAATSHVFYTGSNNTTTTGTARLTISASGAVSIPGTITAGGLSGAVSDDLLLGLANTGDTTMTGDYDKNLLQNVGVFGTVTRTVTGTVGTTWSSTDENIVFDSSEGTRNKLSGSDANTVVEWLIDYGSLVVTNSNATWQPYVQFRGFTTYSHFKTITVSFSANGTDWFEAGSDAHKTTDSAASYKVNGLWMAPTSTLTVPSSLTQWRYAKFVFSGHYNTGSGSNPSDVYFSEIGVRHLLGPWHEKYVNNAGDSLWGTYNYYNNATKTNPTIILTSTTGQVNAKIVKLIDSDTIRLGTGEDANISFDGNSLNFIANAVTSTDTMEFTADKFNFTTGATGAIGVNMATPRATRGGIDIASGGLTLVLGADDQAITRTNTTNKYSRITTYHYTNAEEPICVFYNSNTSTDSLIAFGGGTGYCNAAKNLSFWTAADTTTTTGTERFRIESDGKMRIVADNQLLTFGAGTDCSVTYNGVDMVIDPNLVGTGYLRINGVLACEETGGYLRFIQSGSGGAPGDNDLGFYLASADTFKLAGWNSGKGIQINTSTGTLSILHSAGSAPITVQDTTLCTNLNADKLDGYDVSAVGSYKQVSNTLRTSHDAQANTSSGTYTKLKTITLNGPLRGAIRMKFDYRMYGTSGTGYFRIYHNGVAIGTERTGSPSSSWTSAVSEDISHDYIATDTIELWAKAVNAYGYEAQVQNFRLYYDDYSGTIDSTNS
jgi:hypothetical protein